MHKIEVNKIKSEMVKRGIRFPVKRIAEEAGVPAFIVSHVLGPNGQKVFDAARRILAGVEKNCNQKM